MNQNSNYLQVLQKNFNEFLEILQLEYDKDHINGSNVGIGAGPRLVLDLLIGENIE